MSGKNGKSKSIVKILVKGKIKKHLCSSSISKQANPLNNFHVETFYFSRLFFQILF